MSVASVKAPRAIVYPDSDGLPMAENTKQFECIVTIKEGLEVEFRDDQNVFVAGDLFWYPVEGEPTIRTAPDTLFVRGRPKGHRRSYLQWLEGGIAPQVVFEVQSPSNRVREQVEKFRFYERYGVEEYYFYDPESGELAGWLRGKKGLEEIAQIQGWVSPVLGVRFEVRDGELQLFGRANRRFLSYAELMEQWEAAENKAKLAEVRAKTAEDKAKLADEMARLADEKARQADEKARRLAEKLRAMGVDPGNGG